MEGLSPKPKIRCTVKALAPFFWLVTCQMARNQRREGKWVLWKIVPAVTEV